MKKVLDILRYGSKQAKLYMWLIILVILITLGLGVTAIIMKSGILGIGFVLALVMTIIFCSSISFNAKGFIMEDDDEIMASDKETNKATDKNTEDALDDKIENDEKALDSLNDPAHSRDYLEKYDPKSLKKLFRVAKVGKHHSAIIIDSCDSQKVYRCPAFVWEKRGQMRFLLLEEHSRVITMPIEQFQRVSYERAVEEFFYNDYMTLKNKLAIHAVFDEVMPNFYTGNVGKRTAYYKNLFRLGDDMLITPHSFGELMKEHIFITEFMDAKSAENYTSYFRRAYDARILWTDTVINTNKYQAMIRVILQSMCDDKSMINFDFEEELNNMVEHRLITEEYAEFYKKKRSEQNKPSRKK